MGRSHEVLKFLGDVLVDAQALARAMIVVSDSEAADIEVARAQRELTHRIEHGGGLKLGELISLHLPHPAMALHDIEH